MQIEKFSVQHQLDRVARQGIGAIETKPFLRASLKGEGCDLPGCNCSPGFWLSISDGKDIMKVSFTKEEAEVIRSGHYISIMEG